MFEKLTIGMDRKQGHKKLIEYFNCHVGCELGVRQAEFSKWLVTNTQLEKVYGVDIIHWDEAVHLQHMFPTKYQFHIMNSLEAPKLFDDGYLDYLHIDDCHSYEHLVQELPLWWPKVKKGGVFSGDDFMNCTDGCEGPFGVQQAVTEFSKTNNLQFYVIGLDETNFDKINEYGNHRGEQRTRHFSGLTSDFVEAPQWFIIKE